MAGKDVGANLLTTELPPSVTSDPGATEHDGSHHSTESITYPIVQVDFDRVQTPLIIGIWILSASIAKIGK